MPARNTYTVLCYIIILVEKSAGIIIVYVKLNYNDVRMFSIESVKKQKKHCIKTWKISREYK